MAKGAVAKQPLLLLSAVMRQYSLVDLQHPISDADMRLNIFRGIRIRFYFFPECGHKDPERCNIVVPVPSPDILRDIGMSQHFAGVPGQQAQQLVFHGCKLQLFPVQYSDSGRKVDGQLSVGVYGALRTLFAVHH